MEPLSLADVRPVLSEDAEAVVRTHGRARSSHEGSRRTPVPATARLVEHLGVRGLAPIEEA